jgi:hypothetical protein
VAERGAPPTLERALVEQRLVGEDALRDAKRTALRRHASLVEVLIDEHTVDEVELADALARRCKLPRARIGAVDDEAVLEVPHDIAAAYLAIPLAVKQDPRALVLAMVDPTNADALRDIAASTDCALTLEVATLSDVRAALPRFYSSMITRMIPRLSPHGDNREWRGEPTTQPHVELPDERSPELRLRALVELLVEKGVLTPGEYEERVRRLARGEDL